MMEIVGPDGGIGIIGMFYQFPSDPATADTNSSPLKLPSLH